MKWQKFLANSAASFMMRLLRIIFTVPAMVAGTALFSLMLLTFTDVILRSVLSAPIQAGADLTRLLMAVMVFSALPVISARGQHISVDLLDTPFRKFRLDRWRDLSVDLLCGAMPFLPAQRIWVLAERSRSYNDVMEYLGIPVFLNGWFIAGMTWVSAGVLILRGVIGLVRPRLLSDGND